jgi:hypothetical protein
VRKRAVFPLLVLWQRPVREGIQTQARLLRFVPRRDLIDFGFSAGLNFDALQALCSFASNWSRTWLQVPTTFRIHSIVLQPFLENPLVFQRNQYVP